MSVVRCLICRAGNGAVLIPKGVVIDLDVRVFSSCLAAGSSARRCLQTWVAVSTGGLFLRWHHLHGRGTMVVDHMARGMFHGSAFVEACLEGTEGELSFCCDIPHGRIRG